MTRMRDLLAAGGLCLALTGCMAHADGPGALADLDDMQVAAAPAPGSPLTLDTPVGRICDDPRGRAVLDRNLPGLRKNPNYFLFQGMSLRELASMSGGRITHAKLEKVRVDLAAMSGGPTPRVAAH
jgi:hypothetical protein